MKKIIIIWSCIFLILSSISIFFNTVEIVEGDGYIQHAPIKINSNADFDAAHGVSGGSGTQNDPWIIENLEINGSGFGYCIYLGNTTDYFIVRDCYLHDAGDVWSYPLFDSGIILFRATNGKIQGNNISNNEIGIYVFTTSDNNMINNNTLLTNNWKNIIIKSKFNIIDNNTIGKSDFGIHFAEASHNTLYNNKFFESGISIWGDTLEHWNTHNIDITNTANEKPIYYWKNRTNGKIPEGAGQVILTNCTNIIIENQNVSGVSNGIELGYSRHNVINNNIAFDNYDGISLNWYSDNNHLSNNTIESCGTGLYISLSNNTMIEKNNFSNNQWHGIYFEISFNNTIIENTLISNDHGFTMEPSKNNTFYHNNIIGSRVQVIGNVKECKWDNGYPSGGNFWSDFVDYDNLSGPNQDQIGRDGIWDNPYEVYDYSMDIYALTRPFNWWEEVPPIIELLSPANGSWIIPNTTIRMEIWDENRNLESAFHSFDEGPNEDFSISFEINTSNWTEGIHIVEVQAHDIFSNKDIRTFSFTIDRTAPTIISTIPYDNSRDVAKNASITIEFSESMDIESVYSSLSITPITNLGNIYWNSDNTTLTIESLLNLKQNTTYTIELGTNTKDVVGYTISEIYSWSFLTWIDTDGDGISDSLDDDDDNDLYLDDWEIFLGTDPKDPDVKPLDTDHDGKPNGDVDNSRSWMDVDDDNDKVLDINDPDPLDPDVTAIKSDDDSSNDDSSNILLLLIVPIIIIGVFLIIIIYYKKRKIPPTQVQELRQKSEMENNYE
jgi:parallel beta-helix repeat protein